jgi:signal transduction histidine kinase
MGAVHPAHVMNALARKARELAGRTAGAGRRRDPPASVDRAARSLRRWFALAILAPVLCFLATAYTLKLWSSALDAAAISISTNGAPSVAYLAAARDRVRLIERRAVGPWPVRAAIDWNAIAALRDEFDRAVTAYRTTEDYPGEFEAWKVMQAQSNAFFAAIDDLAAADRRGEEPNAEQIARVRATADALSSATTEVLEINQREVEAATGQIDSLRRRSLIRDALALAFVVAGTLMGLAGAHRFLKVAEARRRLDADRVSELEIFAGRVAHDLRNPLQSIQLRCSAGARAPTAESARDAFARVIQQTQRMSGIIEALLKFARAAACPDPGSRAGVATVVQEIVAEAQPTAAEAHIELVVEPIPAATVACDANVLVVILSNLVRNAIKYMDGGSQGVRQITLRERLEGASLRLEVDDTGPGLPPGAEARVFEPFVRLQSPTSGNGIGLGLATVKRLVEANRGKVGVESRPGHGCCFWFTLPLVG